jgi:hypothetical protein
MAASLPLNLARTKLSTHDDALVDGSSPRAAGYFHVGRIL